MCVGSGSPSNPTVNSRWNSRVNSIGGTPGRSVQGSRSRCVRITLNLRSPMAKRIAGEGIGGGWLLGQDSGHPPEHLQVRQPAFEIEDPVRALQADPSKGQPRAAETCDGSDQPA